MNVIEINEVAKKLLSKSILDVLKDLNTDLEKSEREDQTKVNKENLRLKYLSLTKKRGSDAWKDYLIQLENNNLKSLLIERDIELKKLRCRRLDVLYELLSATEENVDQLYYRFIESLKDEAVKTYDIDIKIGKQKNIINGYTHEFSKEVVNLINYKTSSLEQRLRDLKSDFNLDVIDIVKAMTLKKLFYRDSIVLLETIYENKKTKGMSR